MPISGYCSSRKIKMPKGSIFSIPFTKHPKREKYVCLSKTGIIFKLLYYKNSTSDSNQILYSDEDH